MTPSAPWTSFGRPMWIGFSLACLALVSSRTAWAEEPVEKEAESKQKWIQLERNEDGEPIAMQTAVVRYRKANDPDGPTVDLIGAIHVGDLSYYEALNKEFEQYDALLFELVAPKGTQIPKGTQASSRHAFGAMQNGMKNMLELEHQLEKVDYTKKNFVHADMSPDEFTKKMAERGETFLSMFFRIMTQSMAAQAKGQQQSFSDLDILRALFSKDRARMLKMVMAEQFSGMESMMVSLGGPEGSTIITERNKVALGVLGEQLKMGQKKIGIFYGAGHMEDMDQRLRNEFGLAPVESHWITAWNLLPKEKQGKVKVADPQE